MEQSAYHVVEIFKPQANPQKLRNHFTSKFLQHSV